MNNFDLSHQHNNVKKLFIGRSMIEMLGVLAIIGVLSIGGLAAYRMAMERYRVNQLLQMISSVYLEGISNCTGKGNCLFS